MIACNAKWLQSKKYISHSMHNCRLKLKTSNTGYLIIWFWNLNEPWQQIQIDFWGELHMRNVLVSSTFITDSKIFVNGRAKKPCKITNRKNEIKFLDSSINFHGRPETIKTDHCIVVVQLYVPNPGSIALHETLKIDYCASNLQSGTATLEHIGALKCVCCSNQ